MINDTEIKKLSFASRIVWKNEYASQNFKLFQEYAPPSAKWRSNSMKMENARFNKHFSDAEYKEILNFRQAPMAIGISSAIMDTADSLFTTTNPIISVSPIIYPDDAKTENSRKVAELYKHLLQNSWHESLGSLQYSRVIFDRGNVGHGLMHLAPRNEYGEFTVDMKWLSWKYFIPDPSSKDILYDDMDNKLYAKPISLKQAYRFVKAIEPDLKYEEFKKEWKGDGTGMSGLGYYFNDVITSGLKAEDNILFIHRSTLEDETHYIIIPNSDKYGSTGFKYSTSPEYTDSMKTQEREGLIKVIPKTKLFLTEYTSIGNYGYKVSYPITQSNIIPFVAGYKDSPYPVSRMFYLYPIQRAFNRAIMSSLLNMSLLNATRVIAEENSIINMKEWVTNASMPGTALRYRLPVPGISKPPEIVEPKPMGEAWLTFPKFLISMAEYVSGMFGLKQGNPEGAPDTFGGMASLQSMSNQRIKSDAIVVDSALSRVGMVAAEFFKEYAPSDGYSSYRDPVEDSEVITRYNRINSTIEDQGEGLPPKVNVRIDEATNLKMGFKNVRFTTQASLGNEAITEAAMLTTLGTQSGVPIQEILPLVLQRLNIKGIDKVMSSIDQKSKLQATVQEQENIIKQLNQKTEQFQNNIFRLAVGLESARAKGELDVELTKFKGDPINYLNQALTNQGDH